MYIWLLIEYETDEGGVESSGVFHTDIDEGFIRDTFDEWLAKSKGTGRFVIKELKED